ncbi:hypothetical protein D9758_011686 [Tetrapyrgos nigripes]|uniref:NAD(P)-binding protein n=1 Tax=Tetrapyrgos nigripes TaxID=182062 RepID=A0A8H5GDG9_9AGAR|nr:hypothetical protein D9758_011686 [Tetrapyrgos nigripes]
MWSSISTHLHPQMSSQSSQARTLPNGKTAIVTGASRGIGRAIALRLARDGYNVTVSDIDLPAQREGLEGVCKEIREIRTGQDIGRDDGQRKWLCSILYCPNHKIDTGGSRSESSVASFHIGDVSKEEDVKRMVDEVVETYGGLDVMVANAGMNAGPGSVLDLPVEHFDTTFAINARGTFLCYKYAAIQMVKQLEGQGTERGRGSGKGGRIIGMSSIAGKDGAGRPQAIAYVGSKFAIRGITQAAAGELGKYGITVNALAPGLIDTENIRAHASETEKKNNWKPGEFFERFNKSVPLGYAGTPEDTASLVSYLVSDEAHFVTGQTVSFSV